MSKNFLDLDVDDDDNNINEGLNVNNDYALKYDSWRRKEEIQKFKDKFGHNLDVFGESDEDDDEINDDDDDDDDDTDGSDVNEEIFDEQFFKVYSALKSKNPSIYDANIRFFNQKEEKTEENQEKTEQKTGEKTQENKKTNEKRNASKEPKMTLSHYHQKLIKEKKGITEEDENEGENEFQNKHEVNQNENKGKGYYEELYEIKKEFSNFLKSNEDEDEDEDLIKGKSFKESNDTRSEKRVDFLSDDFASGDNDINFLKSFWRNDQQLDENEKYLRDFILNKRYLKPKNNATFFNDVQNHFSVPEDNDESIFNDFNEQQNKRKENEVKESEVKVNEIKVNDFNFEGPDGGSLKRYPRIVDSIRESTSKESRSIKRQENKERKKRLKEKELNRLRQLKHDEMEEKLKKLREISGNQNLSIDDLDLNFLLDDEKDFDAEKYDEKMKLLFNNNYYDEKDVNKKPQFDFVPGIDDNMDDDNMDNNQLVNYDSNNDEEPKELNGKKTKRKMKRMSSTNKDVGIFEDLIGGDLPTRFKYRKVEPNDFGLTDEEILWGDDKELNKWCSIKKMSQYRNEDEEKYDVKSYSAKRDDLQLKKKILKSVYEEGAKSDANDFKVGKRKKRKRKSKKPVFTVVSMTKDDNNPEDNNLDENNLDDNNLNDNNPDDNNPDDNNPDNEKSAPDADNNNNDNKSEHKKRNRKHRNRNKNKNQPQEQMGVSRERLKAYGLSNREIKKVSKNKV